MTYKAQKVSEILEDLRIWKSDVREQDLINRNC